MPWRNKISIFSSMSLGFKSFLYKPKSCASVRSFLSKIIVDYFKNKQAKFRLFNCTFSEAHQMFSECFECDLPLEYFSVNQYFINQISPKTVGNLIVVRDFFGDD